MFMNNYDHRARRDRGQCRDTSPEVGECRDMRGQTDASRQKHGGQQHKQTNPGHGTKEGRGEREGKEKVKGGKQV